jgi:hypothetical protein
LTETIQPAEHKQFRSIESLKMEISNLLTDTNKEAKKMKHLLVSDILDATPGDTLGTASEVSKETFGKWKKVVEEIQKHGIDKNANVERALWGFLDGKNTGESHVAAR